MKNTPAYSEIKHKYIGEVMIRLDQLLNLIRLRTMNPFAFNLKDMEVVRYEWIYAEMRHTILGVLDDSASVEPDSALLVIAPYWQGMIEHAFDVPAHKNLGDLFFKVSDDLVNASKPEFTKELFDKLFIMEYIANHRIMTDDSVLVQLWSLLGSHAVGDLSLNGIRQTMNEAYNGFYIPERSIPLILTAVLMIVNQSQVGDNQYHWSITWSATLIAISVMMAHVAKG